jgi:hypothetical protein
MTSRTDTDEFKEAIYRASKIIETYTYPLIRVDERALPDVIASCTFIEVGNSYFLITAAHAVRGNVTGLLTRGDGTLVDVAGRATLSRAPDKDHFDIAAIHIENDFIEKNKINVIKNNMLITQVDVTNPHSRAVSGFPNSMNKQSKILDTANKSLLGKCFTYFGSAEFDGSYSEFSKSPDTHIGMEFLSGTDDSGRHLSTPPWPPRGMSGGGAWLFPDLNQPELIFLEGVFIEGYRRAKKRYAFSTQLPHVVDFIQQTHNNALNQDAAKNAAPVS